MVYICNGTSKENLGLAYTGGLVRNEDSCWQKRFVCNAGYATVIIAELWDVSDGLTLAKQMEIEKFIFENNSYLVCKYQSKFELSCAPPQFSVLLN